jgi:hypothetical protein
MLTLWGSAAVAGAAALGAKWALPPMSKVVSGVLVLGGFGVVYLASTVLMGVPESTVLVRSVRRRFGAAPKH